MEWTDIQITVPQQYAETAEAIATMVSNGGIILRTTVTWNSRHGRSPMWT